jgi:ribosomal protein S18 acetylase RimI-like enzyme
VVAAFAADPAFRFFFPDDGSYGDEAAAFAGYLFDRRVGQGTVWVIEGGASVAMWEPPALVSGSAPLPSGLSAGSMARLDAFHAAVHGALPSEPHWYLGVLATHPDHAGRRWGRAVMATGLRRTADAGVPAYLETANPRNLDIYQRAGWQVTRTVTVAALPVWIMRYLD